MLPLPRASEAWRVRVRLVPVLFALWGAGLSAGAASAVPADRDLADYLERETARLEARAVGILAGPGGWVAQREDRRRDLLDMLGLWPMPERTDLHAGVTGRLERDGVVVEKLHFQSMPGLYVTANLYLPQVRTGRLPAVLYVCGHAQVRTNGVSCGNKAGYQHHGAWFARHGYACLLIDTLQLGEIEGVHHGTHRLGQWWWNSRGYTPAGVEAWNSIRALDYLETRPEVDSGRIGMTGRSGGGSYTWTTAAVDDRVRVAAPVAGITDLRNQVVDGVVEGHCDCMFFINTHRWDFTVQAALVAPRPLLLVNTDADSIFPLDGVQRLHASTRRVYEGLGVGSQLGLVIGPGPHKDTQDLQVPVLRWFNRHLKGEDPPVADAALPVFQPLELRVFDRLPADERNTRAAEWFGPAAGASAVPGNGPDPETTAAVLARLRSRVFAGWPEESDSRPGVEEEGSGRLRVWRFRSQPHVPLELRVAPGRARMPRGWRLEVLDDGGWARAEREGFGVGGSGAGIGTAWLAPRGMGPGVWSGDARKQVQWRRRFMLLGQTVDGMRVWDIRQSIRVLEGRMSGRAGRGIEVAAEGGMAVNAVYAALFEPSVTGLRLRLLPASMREGPDYLNVLGVMDLQEAVDRLRGRGVTVVVDPG